MRPVRILIVDDCDLDRLHLSEVARASAGPQAAIDAVPSFEKAVSAVSGKSYDLILLDDDLGIGTSAFISVVTLRAAGHESGIIVAGGEPKDKRRDELTRAGVTEYHAKCDVTPDIVVRALAA